MEIKHIAILVGLLFTVHVRAQNFEADSVYYTPISKSAESIEKKPLSKFFADTIQNQKLISYFFNVQVGTLIGDSDFGSGKEVTFTSSTIHGITIGKKLRTGLGFGFDSYYSWQTLPIFGSVSWDVLGTKNTQALYVQFDYGWAKPWRDQADFEYGFIGTGGGSLMNTQVGYRIKYHDMKIALAIGAKSQVVYAYFEYPTYLPTDDGSVVFGTPNKRTIKREMNRLSISLVIGWKYLVLTIEPK